MHKEGFPKLLILFLWILFPSRLQLQKYGNSVAGSTHWNKLHIKHLLHIITPLLVRLSWVKHASFSLCTMLIINRIRTRSPQSISFCLGAKMMFLANVVVVFQIFTTQSQLGLLYESSVSILLLFRRLIFWCWLSTYRNLLSLFGLGTDYVMWNLHEWSLCCKNITEVHHNIGHTFWLKREENRNKCLWLNLYHLV